MKSLRGLLMQKAGESTQRKNTVLFLLLRETQPMAIIRETCATL